MHFGIKGPSSDGHDTWFLAYRTKEGGCVFAHPGKLKEEWFGGRGTSVSTLRRVTSCAWSLRTELEIHRCVVLGRARGR